jgi:predicted translin family RNA/ssDNA-binding protein
MNSLQYLAFRLLLEKLSEQQEDAAEMQVYSKKWINNSTHAITGEDAKKYEEANRRYHSITKEINDITKALDENM